MTNIHALIYTDYHIRLAREIAELPETIWYNTPKDRKDMIDAEYIRQKMTKKYIPLNKDRYFDLALKSSDVFFITMRLSPVHKHMHQGFQNIGTANSLVKTPLSSLKSRIVLLNEVVLYDFPGYIPYAHVLLAKSLSEYNYYKEISPNSEIHLIGHPDLERAIFRSNRKNNIGIYLCLQRNDAELIAKRIISDVILLNKTSGPINKVLIKDHVMAGKASKGPIIEWIKNQLKTNGINFEFVNKKKDFYVVADNISYGFVQGSLSSHLLLRAMGVESFYYTTENNVLENPFVIRSKMPPSTFSEKMAGTYNKEEYDRWFKEEFVLDGNCAKRLIMATKGEKYEK